MTRKQYEDKRNNLMQEAQNLINSGKTEEANAKMEEIKNLDEQWDAIAQAQANFNALNKEPQAVNVFGQENSSMRADGFNGEERTKEAQAWASEEYKIAWAKNLMNLPMTAEESAAFKMVNEAYTHTTGNTQIVIPKTVSRGIWEEAGTSIVEVSHANGLITIYGNCGEYYVQLNEPVEKGQALGHTRKKENRGNFYFAARYLGEPVNPMELINQKTAASS